MNLCELFLLYLQFFFCSDVGSLVAPTLSNLCSDIKVMLYCDVVIMRVYLSVL